MAKGKIANFIKIVGVLTFVGTMLSKLMPLLKEENPKLKKKINHIGSLLNELKDEVVTFASVVDKKKK
ncbi:hypothetical protein IPN41_02420 [Candidatus Falkowbacteria bacterium]|jgi:hypothetical protein|nr:MAG: hypothetical protein IPN41_02420 [Candidatus Falkowbacteria bacterium]